MLRGALIAVEGIDRTGKSTQCKALVEILRERQIKAEYKNFPARSTEVGKVIDSYLTLQKDLPDEAIHLLFSANRWECARSIIKTLESGTTVILDRYCYSGVAFSSAKGLDLNWCKSSDRGLPKPDKVYFLTMPSEFIQQRSGFGEERYEVLEFQKKVALMYNQLKDDDWDVINAGRGIAEVQNELLEKTLNLIKYIGDKPIGRLWQ